MKFIERKILANLDAWEKKPGRKPLILRGARQVGKTAAVREFAARRGLDLAECNFERQPKLKACFSDSLAPRDILKELELIIGQQVRGERTLLFFDEIQEAPRAITSLRYFFEEAPSLRVIAAGSLLEFVLGQYSVPVGRIHYEYMYPLCFSEFLQATSREQLVEFMPKLVDLRFEGSSRIAAEELRHALKEYFIIGGMPEAVAQFAYEKSLAGVARVHDDVLQAFRDDIRKYARGDNQIENVGTIFSRIFGFCGQQIAYTKLGDGDDIKRTKKSIQLLEQAMLLHRVLPTQATQPLASSAKDRPFKCAFLDIGLGRFAAGLSSQDVYTSKNLGAAHSGAAAEQFVGQQLLSESSAASEGRKLFYWQRGEKGSSAEIDYLLARDGKVIPVEVKSGKSGTLRSLHAFIDRNPTEFGICLQDIASPRREGKIIFAPLYTIL